jgi:hypothetical protein
MRWFIAYEMVPPLCGCVPCTGVRGGMGVRASLRYRGEREGIDREQGLSQLQAVCWVREHLDAELFVDVPPRRQQ